MIKTIWRTFIYSGDLLALCALLVCTQPGRLAAGSNLDEKARYEQFLEQKAEEVLLKLLGPGKAKVAVQAVIDFSSTERVSSEGARGGGEDLPYKWQNINKAEGGAEAQQLLPGFPVSSRLNPVKAAEAGNVQREFVFPQVLVKRLTVSLVLNEDIPDVYVQKARQVVVDMFALKPDRGDEIIVTKARFAPIWYTAETLNILLKYGIIAGISLVGMLIVGIGFLRMAGAVNNMSGSAQPQHIRMEMGGGLVQDQDPGRAEALEYKSGGRESPQEPSGEAPPDGVIFNVKEEKLGLLVSILAKDDPADISLIAVHLPAVLRSRFIGMLPDEKASEVVASMAEVRFVDPDMILRIKEELERRLSGALGGYEKVLEVIDNADMKGKKRLIMSLEKSHPNVASKVRHRVLLLEDLYLLDDKDFALLAGALTVDKWASVARRIPDAARERLKSNLAERTWKILEQTMKYEEPPEEKIDAAIEELLSASWKLIGEGRIKKPVIISASAIGQEAAGTPSDIKDAVPLIS